MIHLGNGRRGPVAKLVVAFAHWNSIHQRNRLDAPDAECVFHHLLPRRTGMRGIREHAWGKRHASNQNVADVDARVKRGETQKRASKHSGRDQQHDCQCDLDGHKAAVQPARATGKHVRAPARASCSN